MKSVFFLSVLGAALGFLLMEWAIGCGEISYFSDGTWQSNNCFLLPFEVKSGLW